MTAAPLDLDRFFNPRSVALIGATEDLTKFGGRCLKQLLAFGYAGKVFPINPKYKELSGLPCYAGIADLPEAPDHVGIVVPQNHVMATLQACADKGVPFVTLFTAGFAEMGEEGRELQRDLRRFAERTGLRLMGPNCNGMINFNKPFALTSTATINGPRKPGGDIGVVTHSGGLGQVNTMWRAQEMGLGISYEVSCGNDADLDAIDFIEFMVEDDVTKVILTALERISDGEKLFRVARRAAERGKPILAIKLGRTAAGAKAAASHTGAMTGSDEVNSAALRKAGIQRFADTQQLYKTAMLLRQGRLPQGNRAAAMSLSGGNLVILSDLGAELGLDWPAYSQSTLDALGKVLPGFIHATNPTDLTSAVIGHPDRFGEALDTIAADPQIDVLVPVITFGVAQEVRKVAEVAKASKKPVAVLWSGACIDQADLKAETLIAEGVAVYRDAGECLAAIRAAADYGEFQKRFKAEKPPVRPAGTNPEAARARLARCGPTLTEREAKEVLAAYGLPTSRERLARNAAEAVAAAKEIGGPVALKIESADIPHKTEAGAIRLGVTGDAAVGEAFEAVMAAAKAYKPDAKLDGVLVQEMAPQGVEMILGVAPDMTFGPVLVAGLGGIHVEVLGDVAYGMPPVGPAEAEGMLRGLRGWRLLEGVRGAAPRDLAALTDLICRLSWFAKDLGDVVAEVDLNPVVVLADGKGLRIVDALLVRPA